MRIQKRQRRYVGRHWIFMMRPALRYSVQREAYVLRGVGRKWGPVLRVERRRTLEAHGRDVIVAQRFPAGAERRRVAA